ncbi:MAG TPA: signal peptidase II [Hyphomonadaceae bacterium]|nr:signal peptidase II [Hyphomonadaceae bacterium]
MDWLSREKITRHWRWGLPLIAGIIALDQLTKAGILGTPSLRAIDCLNGASACGHVELSPIVDFTMMWNPGVSFGFLQALGGGRWLLFVMIGAIVAGFTVWLFRAERRMTAVALSMVVGGAIGNLVDRARFGAVVDFVDFGPLFPWIFNVADASITMGAAALLLDQLLAGRKRAS